MSIWGELDELVSSRPLEIPEQFSIIRLANGDEVYGTLKALDAENLQLQTAWGGLLQVDRKYVRHIGFDSQKPTCATLRNPCRAGSLQPKARCPNAATDTGSCAAPIIRNCKLPSPCHPASMCSSPFTIPIRSGLILPSGRIPNPETASTWISPGKSGTFQEQFRPVPNAWQGERNTERNWYADKSVKRSDVHFTPIRKRAIITCTSTVNR